MEQNGNGGWLIFEHFHKTFRLRLFLVIVHFEIDIRRITAWNGGTVVLWFLLYTFPVLQLDRLILTILSS
jgi:hypothetical protein